jgi:hypothetical protein
VRQSGPDPPGTGGAGTAGPAPAPALGRFRRPYPLVGEMAFLVGVVLVWQLLRIPFEVPADRAIANARRWLALEQDLGIAVERRVAGALAARPDLRDVALVVYQRLDAALVFAVLATLRLLDPRRYPTVRTAFVLVHVPALMVLALHPMAPPKWLPGWPGGTTPPVDLSADLLNQTAAAVSLHVGIPVLLAVAAIWMRPSSRLAWATVLYPAAMLWIVVATANHFVLDAVVGGACVALAWAVARAAHGAVPPSPPEAGARTIALAGLACAVLLPAANAVLLRLAA